MKIGLIAENPAEGVVLWAGMAPTPLAQTIVGMWLARTIMVAVKVGVFETLAHEPLTAREVADHCHTEPHATEKLLFALAGAEYVRVVPNQRRARHRDEQSKTSERAAECGRQPRQDQERYGLAPIARRWLLESSPCSLRDAVLHQFLDAQFIEHYEDFVVTGRPVEIHTTMTPEQWGVYQRGMRAGASLYAPEVARRTPVPKGARDMLDIGGAHGYFSVALCRRYPGLQATILDLPPAIEQSAWLLAREGMGKRVVQKAGNALTEELGVERYDLIFISSLLHHFDDETNRALIKRAAVALRPGGSLVVQEVFRPASASNAGQLGALADLYFAVTSEAGTWSPSEIATWQCAAGLNPRKPIEFLFAPGTGQQSARKPK